MRVLVNDLWSSGAKTGIGHYTAQLMQALRGRAAGDRIESFPGRWLTRMHGLGRRMRSALERESKGAAGAARPDPARGWRAWCVGRARSLGRIVLALDLRLRGAGATCTTNPTTSRSLPTCRPW